MSIITMNVLDTFEWLEKNNLVQSLCISFSNYYNEYKINIILSDEGFMETKYQTGNDIFKYWIYLYTTKNNWEVFISPISYMENLKGENRFKIIEITFKSEDKILFMIDKIINNMNLLK